MAKESSKRKITIQGKKFVSIQSAATAFGKSRNTVDYRLSKGWTPEQAVGVKPPPSFASKTTGIPVRVEGREFKNIKEAAKYYKRAYTHVVEMLKKARSIEQALGLVKRADTLETENPKLAKQWHPVKNVLLAPKDVSCGSGKKVWWLCSNNHEWEAVINSRNRGMGCPYCAGQRVTKDHNFAVAYPELLKELDFNKNENLDLSKLAPRSNKKVWWKCDKGHSWQATIQNKTRKFLKSECPYCSNRKVGEDNNLAYSRPDIAKDWHPTKNGKLTPNDVVAGGSKKVWWVCKHNHEWQTTVGLRVISGTGCPKCHLQTSRIEIAVYCEMLALFSNVSWQEKIEGYECDILLKDKNIGIEIDGVYWHKRRPEVDTIKQNLFERKGIQLFRFREKGLELLSERDISFKWSDNTFPIISRMVKQILKFAQLNEEERFKLEGYTHQGTLVNEKQYRKIVSQLPAPPIELSLAVKNPEIAKEWAYDLNAPLSPEHFRPSASKYVWWRCSQGHVWKNSLNHRTNQNAGCPTCPRTKTVKITDDWNFAAIHTDLVKEWDYVKNGNLRPEGIRPKSHKKVWWNCGKGHYWQATPSDRSNGKGCPFCYGRYATGSNNLAVLFPEVLDEWDSKLNKGLNPSDYTAYSPKKVWWKCRKEPKHSWQTGIYNRTKKKSGCPHCVRNNARKYSIEYFKEFARKRKGKCLSKEYITGKTKIKMICKKGHKWETRAENIIYEKKWCTRCSKVELSAQLSFKI